MKLPLGIAFKEPCDLADVRFVKDHIIVEEQQQVPGRQSNASIPLPRQTWAGALVHEGESASDTLSERGLQAVALTCIDNDQLVWKPLLPNKRFDRGYDFAFAITRADDDGQAHDAAVLGIPYLACVLRRFCRSHCTPSRHRDLIAIPTNSLPVQRAQESPVARELAVTTSPY